MELSFIRNQIELKLKETEVLINLYAEGLEKEFSVLDIVIDETQKKEIDGLINQIGSIIEDLDEIEQEFSIVVAQLTTLYPEIHKKYKLKVEELIRSRTSTFENITIIRQALRWRQLADSIGYDKEHKLMDLAYSSGSVYRYYEVPEEYFETLKTRNNLKGFKTEIAEYKSVKIS